MAIINASDWNPVINKMRSVVGTPDATTTNLGYNNTPAASAVSVNAKILGSDWNNLRSDINKAYTLQTGSASDLTARNSNYLVTASDLTTISARVDTAYSNRLSRDAGQYTLQTGVSGTGSGTWSSSCSADPYVEWIDNATYRGFFNSGGIIEITSSRSGGSATSQNQSWTNLLSNMGSIIIARDSCYQAGGASQLGTFSISNGVYGGTLDTTTRTLFYIASTDANYTPNYFQVSARINTSDPKTATRVTFNLYWIDNHTASGAGPDSNNGSLTFQVKIYYALGQSLYNSNYTTFTQT